MLHFRLKLVSTGEPRWGPPDNPVSVYGTTADGDGGVHLDVTGLRPFVTVALPTESPPFDEERVEELTSLLAPVLASAADYRGRRLKLGVCTQALEQTRVEYEQPPGPARTLRIVFNCSAVAAEVARVLQAPEAAAAAWTYPLSVDADSLVAMLGDARGGIRVLDPETASNPTACFAARTGVAPKRWCTADTAWPDVEHEHDRPVTLSLEQFHPAPTPAKRKLSDAEVGDASCPERDWRLVRKEQAALAEGWVARRAFDDKLVFLFEAALWKNPRLHALFSEAELRTATLPFIVAVFLAQDRADSTVRDWHVVEKDQLAQVEAAKWELKTKWDKRPAFADRLVFCFRVSKGWYAMKEKEKEKEDEEEEVNKKEKETITKPELSQVEKEQMALAERWVARRAFDERLEHLFEAVMWENPHLHAMFSEADLRVAYAECIERRRECKDRRVYSVLLSMVTEAKDKALGRGWWRL
jgi:hypothetical protein